MSLNADTEDIYDEYCKPIFGARAYKHVLDFIKACAANKIEAEVTCLDIKGVNIDKCEKIAKSLDAILQAQLVQHDPPKDFRYVPIRGEQFAHHL